MSIRTRQLLQENNRLEEELSPEGKDILTDMVVYLRGCNISPFQQELVRRDITWMLIDGEQRGDTAVTVIGDDYCQFCDSVLREIPHMTWKEKMAGIVRDNLLALAVLLAIWLIGGVLENAALYFLDRPAGIRLSVTAGNLLGGLIILAAADGLFLFLSRTAFQRVKKWKVWNAALLFAAFFAGIFVNILLTAVLFRLHIAAAVLLTAAVFLAYMAADRIVD